MGLYLDLDYDINAFSTDTTDFSLFENNGNGIALDLTGSFNVLNHKFDFYMFDLDIFYGTITLESICR